MNVLASVACCILIIAQVKWSLILLQKENNDDFYSKSTHSGRMLHFQFRFYFIFKYQVGKSQITADPKQQLNLAPQLCILLPLWDPGFPQSSHPSLPAPNLCTLLSFSSSTICHLGDKFQVILLSTSKCFIAQEWLRTWARGKSKDFSPLLSFSWITIPLHERSRGTFSANLHYRKYNEKVSHFLSTVREWKWIPQRNNWKQSDWLSAQLGEKQCSYLRKKGLKTNLNLLSSEPSTRSNKESSPFNSKLAGVVNHHCKHCALQSCNKKSSGLFSRGGTPPTSWTIDILLYPLPVPLFAGRGHHKAHGQQRLSPQPGSGPQVLH